MITPSRRLLCYHSTNRYVVSPLLWYLCYWPAVWRCQLWSHPWCCRDRTGQCRRGWTCMYMSVSSSSSSVRLHAPACVQTPGSSLAPGTSRAAPAASGIFGHPPALSKHARQDTHLEGFLLPTSYTVYCSVPLVLWCCWLSVRKSIQPIKIWVMRCWHVIFCSKVQVACIWFSWCHYHPIMSENREWLILLVLTHLGSPGQRVVKRL